LNREKNALDFDYIKIGPALTFFSYCLC